MNAPVAHREQMLREFGVVPYRLRRRDDEPVPADEPAATAVMPDAAECVLVLPAGCSHRELDLLGRAMQAFGPAFARAPRMRVDDDGGLADVPQAPAYLAFGEAQARALGRVLSAAQMATAEIVLLDPPSQLMQAAGKRRLWSAVNALRRRWRQPPQPGE
jgi:hypothetical protein